MLFCIIQFDPVTTINVSKLDQTFKHKHNICLKLTSPIVWLGLWCLTALSTIFQLYRGNQFLFVEGTGVPEENNRPVASR